ncbi:MULTISPECIES: flagellar hook-associated protein FlgL [unclassified Clostridioides]|uniref:flagellar hook-associated protein FlgL n=1 Tax=unclassified Clostridioides TaxID=2635829 RepID=UPI001D1077B1|nr:flagellar hook-associated protein FlgL [Clostridioides sp. ZZV15-6598]MCC0729898.1 flagellar hook-associated protein FlgL [Clostridioides sp. ZZV14-6048]MCC0734780.1 flagellar hook-associated protein FlgL [Clostridioides sp. ZZV14-6009]
MRVSTGMMSSSYLNSLQDNLQRLDKVNRQVNTTKEINKLSDNPYKAIKILNSKSEIKTMETYIENCNDTGNWLETTDTALDQLGKLLSDVKKTLVASGDGAYSEDELKTLSNSTNEKMKEIANALNATHEGKYIFSGSNTGTPPVQYVENADGSVSLKFNSGINLNKLQDSLSMNIAQGINVEYNVKLSSLGFDPTKTDPFEDLNNISRKLINPSDADIKDLTTTCLSGVDKLIENTVNTRSIYGTKANTVDAMKEKNDENLIQLKDILSQNEEIDYGEKLVQLKAAELTYQASLQTGGKLFNVSILDYI